MLRKTILVLLVCLFATPASASKNRPDGYKTVCRNGEQCHISELATVAFGASDRFEYKNMSGTFTCSAETFGGDPIPWKSVKECSVSKSVDTSRTGNEQGIQSGLYAIVSRYSGLALDVEGGSSADGANVIQWSYKQGANQQFKVDALGNGFYTIRPRHSDKSLDVINFSSEPGGEIRQWSYTGNYNQQWAITSAGEDFYTITSRHSGLALDVWTWESDRGGDIRQWKPTGAANQQWLFEKVGSASGDDSGSTPPATGDRGSSCVSTGSEVVSSTIRVTSGTYDGHCKTFNPTAAVGDGSQSESQDPVFRVENGATLKNVIIGNNGADGIHVYNGGTLENIRWTNVGEDAMTVKSEGDVTLRNIEGYDGDDKFLQINAPTNLVVTNCIADNMGKFLRQNGGTDFELSVTVDNCEISNMSEGIFRSDGSRSTAHISNSHLNNAGQVCIGRWESCTSSGLSGR